MPFPGCSPSGRAANVLSDPQGVAVGLDAGPGAGTIALHMWAPAQELLDSSLVRVAVVHPAHDGIEPKMLAQAGYRLPRSVAVLESGRLEAAVVEPAPETHQVEHLAWHLEPEAPEWPRDEPFARSNRPLVGSVRLVRRR